MNAKLRGRTAHVKLVETGRTKGTTVRVSALLAERSLYDNYSSQQRHYVWELLDKQLYIFSMMMGEDFITLSPLNFNSVVRDGRTILEVVEGQNRLRTIYGFLNNEFKTIAQGTLSHIEPIPLVAPYPGRYFRQLPDEARASFEGYLHPVQIASDVSPEIAGVRYRLLNRSVPPTAAEMLYSYESATKQFALELVQHPVWAEQYKMPSSRDRRQVFEMALYAILIELEGYPVEIRKSVLTELVSGKSDERITEDFKQSLWDLFSLGQHVYKGVRMSAKTDVIIWIIGMKELLGSGLDKEHPQPSFDLWSSTEGCLTSWYMSKARLLMRKHMFESGTYSNVMHPSVQRTFFLQQQAILRSQEGLVRR